MSAAVLEPPPALSAGSSRYRIHAVASGQVIMRVLEHFAQRDMTPDRIVVERQDETMLSVAIDQSGLCDDKAQIILEKLCQIVGVERAIMLNRKPLESVANDIRCC